MTDSIAAFYDSHPYPPPVANLDRARDEWRDPNRHRAEYHLFWPRRPFRADLDILVAGCGTWQAARYAVCRPGARVLGIDLSTTSLDRTERLKRQYDLTNLETRQAAIEGSASLDRSFDLIVCTGVLHHLADPDAGLRALESVLKPRGVIYLMVYAPYSRAGVYMLQDYCRMLGIEASDRDITDLVAVLKAMPQQHPLAAVLRGSRDADNPDALADALLNPRDRAYSVPQLFDFVERAGLRFVRWHNQAPYLPQCGAMAATPHAARLARLPERERSAAMELWRGTFSTHSAVVSASDAGARETTVRFDDGLDWQDYVPVRRPETVCVEERLPPGAAGALISRYHSSPDLVMLIDGGEKRMLDGIDGQRTIAEIAGGAGVDGRSRPTRAFFERLYWFDQIVIDASNTGQA